MSRLIDAEKLKEVIEKEKDDNDYMCRLCMESIKDIIDKQPTAFDMDKVIEQLDNEADRSSTYFEEYADEIGKSEDDDWHYMGLRRAIEIVKGSGIK